MMRGLVLGVILVLGAPCDLAQAYVDPVTSRTAIHIFSALFIILSAGFVFLKNQIFGFFRFLARLLKHLVP